MQHKHKRKGAIFPKKTVKVANVSLYQPKMHAVKIFKVLASSRSKIFPAYQKRQDRYSTSCPFTPAVKKLNLTI